MKRLLVTLAITLLVLAAQQPARAQTSDSDFSAGYGYLPAGYGSLASAQMDMPAAPAPTPGMPGAGMSGPGAMGPAPFPQYQGDPSGFDLFAPACAGVNWQIVGEYLYLRPTNAEVTYAQVVDATTGVPFGRTGVSTPYYDTGFRVSAAAALGDCAAIGVSYTYFDTTVNSRLDADENPLGNVYPDSIVSSLVLHPLATPIVSPNGEFATASETIRFHLADVDYKAALVSGPRYCANLVVGARFLSLDQHFDSSVNIDATDSDLMYTNVRFEGGGVRLGLEGERQSPSTGFLVYGKGSASFVGGTARADYSQFNTDPGGAYLVDTAWKSNRVITMLDFEVGAGWASVDGRIRVTGGYMVSGWYNTVKLDRYIKAVQDGNPTLLDSPTENALAFDGLVFRTEVRF